MIFKKKTQADLQYKNIMPLYINYFHIQYNGYSEDITIE